MPNSQTHFQDSPERFDELPCEQQEIIRRWTRESLRPCKTPLYKATSYLLKHIQERDTGLYCTNGQFKGAMLRCGYEPVNPNALN